MVKKAKVFKPGDFVFAKVKGYPAWPAKVTTINGKKYSIYFYGTGETGNLPPNDLFDYFENKKQFLAKVIKRRDYNDGLVEIENEITSLGLGEAASAGAAADVTAETDGDAIAEENDPNNTTADEEKGEDADKTNDPTADKAKESVENRTAEDMEINEPEEPVGAVDATETEVATDPVENDSSVETPVPEAEKETAVSTPVRAKRVTAAPKTPQSQKTPRRGMKQEPVTPKAEPKTPLAETISRSGRKIKPKRYLDESQDSSPEGSKPGGKRAKLTSGPVDESIDQDQTDAQAVGAESAADTQPEKTSAKKGKKAAAQNGEAVKKISDRFNLVNTSELEDIQEPFSKKDGEAARGPRHKGGPT